MRKRFETQITFGIIPIADIKFEPSRHELTPTLAGLQHIFITPELNEKVFEIIEKKIPAGNLNSKGREGMNLWEILVLAVCRLTLDANYDEILDLANQHQMMRTMMQVSFNSFTNDNKVFKMQTVKDNLMLLDEDTIMQINELVVSSAHHLILKKNEKLRIKSDTFVLETNVAFPTDYKLLLASANKILKIVKKCVNEYNFEEWRKLKSWRSQLKNLSRAIGQLSVSKSKDKEKLLQSAVNEYITLANNLAIKTEKSVFDNLEKIKNNNKLTILIEQDLVFYMAMLYKHIQLLERRVIKGEIIPNSEKIYSIFETHTEWICKGKANKKVELGHNILIATCQYNFILYSKVIENRKDCQLVLEIADRLLLNFNIQSISFDKGFYSKENKSILQLAIPHVIMPKKGKLNTQEKEEERDNKFKKLRYAHSAVESNINELEHHGLNRCPDKGLHRFKTYTSLAVLSYNLKKLGKILLKLKIEKQNLSEQLRQAA